MDKLYFRKQTKYRAKKTTCFNGHTHDSKLEAGHCNRLHAEMRAGKWEEIEVQVTVPLKIGDVLWCNHVVDFRAWPMDGSPAVYIESKGVKTRDFMLKYKAFKILYPTTKYEIWGSK